MSSDTFVLMFVCTGNTCRSPMAEGILQSMAERDKVQELKIVSAGTGTLDGYPASMNSVLVAQKDGIDISHHHSRALNSKLVTESDLILTMAYNHFQDLTAHFPEMTGRIFMLKSFPDRKPSSELSVEDPIGSDFETYKSTYLEIKRELMRIWPDIKKKIHEKLHKT